MTVLVSCENQVKYEYDPFDGVITILSQLSTAEEVHSVYLAMSFPDRIDSLPGATVYCYINGERHQARQCPPDYYWSYDLETWEEILMPETVATLITADNHWALLAVLFTSTFLAIFLEQKYRWASRVTGAVITLLIAIVLVNLRVIPSEAPVFDDFVWGYAVPLAVPLLLLQTSLRKIWREAGRFLAIFMIGAAGTVAGAILATVLLRGAADGLPEAAAMMTGSYIGGGVNFTALAAAFHAGGTLRASVTVADNLNMAIYFLVLLSAAGSRWLRKHYPHPHIDDVLANGKVEAGETMAARYWAPKEISLKDSPAVSRRPFCGAGSAANTSGSPTCPCSGPPALRSRLPACAARRRSAPG